MTTRKKSSAIKEFEKIRKGPLTFQELLHSVRATEEVTQEGQEDSHFIAHRQAWKGSWAFGSFICGETQRGAD